MTRLGWPLSDAEDDELDDAPLTHGERVWLCWLLGGVFLAMGVLLALGWVE